MKKRAIESSILIIAFICMLQLSSAALDCSNGICVDNSDTGFSTVGTWDSSIGATTPYGGTAVYSKTAGQSATWSTPPVPGVYEVFVTWTYKESRPPKASYTIFDGTKQLGVVDMNQVDPALGGIWNSLGKYSISSIPAKVTLTVGNDGKSYNADAVKFVRVSDIPTQQPSPPTADATCVDSADQANHLSAMWKFDGNFEDSTLNTSVERRPLAINLANGKLGQAFNRNPSIDDSYLEIRDSIFLNPQADPFSLSLWIYPRKSASDQALLYKLLSCPGFVEAPSAGCVISGVTGANYHGYYLILTDGNQISAGFGDGVATFSVDASLTTSNTFSQWHHVVVVMDRVNDKVILYLDGAKAAELDDRTSNIDHSSNLYIGRKAANTVNYDGLIDDVAIFKKALSANEVSKLYNSGNGLAACSLSAPIVTPSPSPSLPSRDPLIIDNEANTYSSFASVGDWRDSGAAGFYGANSLYSRTPLTGVALDQATWSVALEPGTYEVYAWWTAWSTRTQKAPYSIYNGNVKLATLDVDQRNTALGGRWNLLGKYAFGSQGKVILNTRNDDLSYNADAVRFVKTAGPTQSPSPSQCVDADGDGYGLKCSAGDDCKDDDKLIHPFASEVCGDGKDNNCNGQTDEGCGAESGIKVDDGASGFSKTGAWETSGGLNSYGGTSLYSQVDGAEATWSASLPKGVYQVYARWTYWNSRPSNALYIIYNGQTPPVEKRMDQLNPTLSNSWQLLGEFTFDQTGKVVLRSEGKGSVNADAVSFLKIRDVPVGCTPVAEICDGKDNDCDGVIDEEVKKKFYPDTDGDGYGAFKSGVKVEIDTRNPIKTVTVDGSQHTFEVTSVHLSNGIIGLKIDSGQVTNLKFDDTQVINGLRVHSAPGDLMEFSTDPVNGYVKTLLYVGNSAPLTECKAPQGYVANTQDCNDVNTNLTSLKPCKFNNNQCGTFQLCVESVANCPIAPIEICGNSVDENCNGNDDDICAANLSELQLSEPRVNGSYLNRFVPVVFIAKGASQCWYVLDGTRKDIPCNERLSLRLLQGKHSLGVFANNSRGVIEQTREFEVNFTRRFIVRYDKFAGKGETTGLDTKTDDELAQLDNFVLEGDYGKIAFLERVDLKANANYVTDSIDLDSVVLLDFNRIEVKSDVMPSLNKRTRLTLRGLSFTNPRILKDGSVCYACTKELYLNGTLTFIAPGFSVYQAEETPGSVFNEDDEGGGRGVPRIINKTDENDTVPDDEGGFDNRRNVIPPTFDDEEDDVIVPTDEPSSPKYVIIITIVAVVLALAVAIFFVVRQIIKTSSRSEY